MILVNNPGTWDAVYSPLRHATWNGCTPADLIFPFFLFIVGVAVTFSFSPTAPFGGLRTTSRRPLTQQAPPGAQSPRLTHSKPGEPGLVEGTFHSPSRLLAGLLSFSRGLEPAAVRLAVKIIRRTVLLFALGIFLNGFPLFDWSELRIPGVLQRIALCYGGAAFIVLALSIRAQAVVTMALLLGYWAVLALVPVPGRYSGGFAVQTNLAAWVDDALLHGHLLWESWDPEGVLSTFPALATTLAGVLTGHWLRAPRRPIEHVAGLYAAGVSAVTVGTLLANWCPLNKSLWTSSYVLFTAGIALIVLAACHWLIDIKHYRRWATPFLVYGTNPIVAYVLSSLTTKVLLLWKITDPAGGPIDLQRYIFETCFLPLARPLTASLLYAVAYVLVWLGVTAVLYRQKVLIKI
jgi:predicted acyltransferase